MTLEDQIKELNEGLAELAREQHEQLIMITKLTIAIARLEATL